MPLSVGIEAANAEANAVSALLDGGYLRLYAGRRPSTVDEALNGALLLAELRFGAPAFGAAAGGLAVALTITAETAAEGTGTAAFFRTFKADGLSPVLDGDVTETGGGGDLTLGTTTIVRNAYVTVDHLSLTAPRS